MQENIISNNLVRIIKDHKLEAPAVLILESCKPISKLAHITAIAFEPITTAIFGTKFTKSFSELLSDRDNIELLIQAIEAKQL